METVLNKLRSTMSSAASNAVSNAVHMASQVSNYLPGNPVTREYEAVEHVASAGTDLSWKVYSGYKKSNKQEVSLFVFEKRSLDRWDRQQRELLLAILRRGVAQLTRIKHPQVLTVQHPLEESRDSLAFATEPVLASLANLFGQSHNMPSHSKITDYKLHDVEIKYGFLQVCEALQFLHQSVKAVHLSVSPDTVVVNKQGAWKLFGFDFCQLNAAPPDSQPLWQSPDYRPNLPPSCVPPLEYLAPECITGAHSVSPASDLFSVGALITAVFNDGKPYTAGKGNLDSYRNFWQELGRVSCHQLAGVPDKLRETTRLLLQPVPDKRLSAQQLVQVEYFSDVAVKTLSYLDQMFQWDNVQKSQFYKGLPQLIPQLPHRVALLRIVPSLVQESVNPSMVPFILPVVLLVAERSSDQEFVDHILPHLRPIMAITEPVQIMLQLLQHMSLLLSKTPPAEVRSDLLPLLYRALDTNTIVLQELCLSALPTCAKQLDKQTMKSQLLPRVQKLCLATTSLSVRVNCLVCVGRILPQLDKWLVLDLVVPFLTQLPSREAPIIMAVVGILQVSMQSSSLGLTKEVMATSLLPFLIPLSIENCLSPQQHSTLLVLIRDMLNKVEAEHKTKLEYLNSIKDEQKTLQQLMPESGVSSSSNSSGSTEMDCVFTGLGLGQYVNEATSVGKAAFVANGATAVSKTSSLLPAAKPSQISVTPAAKNTAVDLTSTLSPLAPPPTSPALISSFIPKSPGQFSSSSNFVSSVGYTSSSNMLSSASLALNNSLNANLSSMKLNGLSSEKKSSAFDDLLPAAAKPKSMNEILLNNHSLASHPKNAASFNHSAAGFANFNIMASNNTLNNSINSLSSLSTPGMISRGAGGLIPPLQPTSQVSDGSIKPLSAADINDLMS